MATLVTKRQVTDEELRRFAVIVYDRTGIRISPQKKTLLSNRLRRRMRALGIEDYDEYYRLLVRVGIRDAEWDAFLQEITTHETYLFRDPSHWDWFAGVFLPEIQKEARRGDREKTLRVWSAACSTGDEAYTIACCIADRLTNYSQWDIEIVGTDIGIGALEAAEAARFSKRAMLHVSESQRRRFFTQVEQDVWEAKPVLRQWTKFRQHNLMDPMRGRPFDLVFVKNVLIYFDSESKKTVVRNVDKALKQRGMLVTGPAEGISQMLSTYERVEPWLHRKPAEK